VPTRFISSKSDYYDRPIRNVVSSDSEGVRRPSQSNAMKRSDAQVRAGAEVIIEHDAEPVAVLHAPVPQPRNLAACLELLSKDSTATIDGDFAKDVEAAINSHREPLTPPEWD
jgi:antitoxin (DNA-binding transcriptional repressor) of toxin-antitoxin stability system